MKNIQTCKCVLIALYLNGCALAWSQSDFQNRLVPPPITLDEISTFENTSLAQSIAQSRGVYSEIQPLDTLKASYPEEYRKALLMNALGRLLLEYDVLSENGTVCISLFYDEKGKVLGRSVRVVKPADAD